MKDNGNAVGHGFLERGEVGDHGLERVGTEVPLQFAEVVLLILTQRLEPRRDIAE
jgi:hypothetical protein